MPFDTYLMYDLNEIGKASEYISIVQAQSEAETEMSKRRERVNELCKDNTYYVDNTFVFCDKDFHQFLGAVENNLAEMKKLKPKYDEAAKVYDKNLKLRKSLLQEVRGW